MKKIHNYKEWDLIKNNQWSIHLVLKVEASWIRIINNKRKNNKQERVWTWEQLVYYNKKIQLQHLDTEKWKIYEIPEQPIFFWNEHIKCSQDMFQWTLYNN